MQPSPHSKQRTTDSSTSDFEKNLDQQIKEWAIVYSIAAIFLVLLGIFSSLGCATNPPDEPVCVEITPEQGYCKHMLSNRSFDVDETHPMLNAKGEPIMNPETKKPYTWWEIRNYMLQVPVTTWVEIKTFIIKTCKKTGACKQKEIESWNRTAADMDSKLKEKGAPLP